MILGGKTQSQRASLASAPAPLEYLRIRERTWAELMALDPAAEVGRVYAVSDVGPAPGIQVISDGTKFRPAGGTQLLDRMVGGSLVSQNLSYTLIDTTPTFPAGLMQPGLALHIRLLFGLGAIGTNYRHLAICIGPPGSELANPKIAGMDTTTSNSNLNFSIAPVLKCLATSGVQRMTANFTVGVYTTAGGSHNSPAINFTVPWNLGFIGLSAAETAQTGVTATWAAGVATFAKTAHGYAVGDKVVTTTFTPTGYNGTLIVASVPTADTWTSAIVADPGGAGTGGTSSRVSNVQLDDYSVMLVG